MLQRRPMKRKQETMIITGKSRKKYVDKQGNEINDPDIIAEVQKGYTVISYHEEKQGQNTIIDKDTRRLIRSKKDLDKLCRESMKQVMDHYSERGNINR